MYHSFFGNPDAANEGFKRLYPELFKDILSEIKSPSNPELPYIISGIRGSGKTALIRYSMKELTRNLNIKWYYINCAEDETSYKILKRITGERKKIDQYKALNRLIDLFNSEEYKKHKIFIILDEIDLLKDDRILY